jgi:hypothetical protein
LAPCAMRRTRRRTRCQTGKGTECIRKTKEVLFTRQISTGGLGSNSGTDGQGPALRPNLPTDAPCQWRSKGEEEVCNQFETRI